MVDTNSSHCIAPAQILRGETAWQESQKNIPLICQTPLIIGRSEATYKIREELTNDLKESGLTPIKSFLEHDCCELDIKRLKSLAIKNSCDGVLAAGGGKVLDAGKLLAHRLSVPCITVPLSAATCAGWTALANIYSPDGAFQKDLILDRCPSLLIFDHGLVRQAPKRTLASGIADALAKWYEASASNSDSTDGLVQQAVQLARVLRDQLFIDGGEALKNPNSEAWVRVAEGCALTAGLIGGIGGARCRTAAAHAVHNGLTQLEACKNVLHGEKVGFGILVQLRLEEVLYNNQLAGQARRQLIAFLSELNLPINLQDLGLSNLSRIELQKACNFACKKDSDMHNLPFTVNPSKMLEALIGADEEKSALVRSNKTQGKVP